jgi:glutathione S-transferase
MRVYDFPASPNCRKVRAVAYELGAEIEFVPVNIFKGEAKTPAALARNPNARVPVLEDGDFVLWESNAIISYLAAGTALVPSGRRERAEVDRWLHWQLAHIGPAISKVAFERIVKPLRGGGPVDQTAIDAGATDFHQFAAVLEGSLGRKEYVAGKLSVADFALASVFSVAEPAGLDLRPHPQTSAWLARIFARESMKLALADAHRSMEQLR